MAQRYKSIIRSRAVRGRILEVLIELNAAAPGISMMLDDLMAQVSGGTPFAMDPQELQAEILYLTEKKLVELDNGHARITANGMDFRRAGMPWDGVDVFSGKMK
jgi:hypothetical protein